VVTLSANVPVYSTWWWRHL